MAWTVLTHTAAASGNDSTVTTSAIDTTGADFLVVVIGYFSSGLTRTVTITDSKVGNVWTPLTVSDDGVQIACQIVYCKNPAQVGTNHTFTGTSVGGNALPSICIATFRGADLTSPFDVQNGAFNTGSTSLQTGSVTPGSNFELIITGLGSGASITEAIDSGFTILDQNDQGAHNQGSALAYKLKTDVLAENPTWSWSGSVAVAARIATFKQAAGGGGSFGGSGFDNFIGQLQYFGPGGIVDANTGG